MTIIHVLDYIWDIFLVLCIAGILLTLGVVALQDFIQWLARLWKNA